LLLCKGPRKLTKEKARKLVLLPVGTRGGTSGGSGIITKLFVGKGEVGGARSRGEHGTKPTIKMGGELKGSANKGNKSFHAEFEWGADFRRSRKRSGKNSFTPSENEKNTKSSKEASAEIRTTEKPERKGSRGHEDYRENSRSASHRNETGDGTRGGRPMGEARFDWMRGAGSLTERSKEKGAERRETRP